MKQTRQLTGSSNTQQYFQTFIKRACTKFATSKLRLNFYNFPEISPSIFAQSSSRKRPQKASFVVQKLYWPNAIPLAKNVKKRMNFYIVTK